MVWVSSLDIGQFGSKSSSDMTGTSRHFRALNQLSTLIELLNFSGSIIWALVLKVLILLLLWLDKAYKLAICAGFFWPFSHIALSAFRYVAINSLLSSVNCEAIHPNTIGRLGLSGAVFKRLSKQSAKSSAPLNFISSRMSFILPCIFATSGIFCSHEPTFFST